MIIHLSYSECAGHDMMDAYSPLTRQAVQALAVGKAVEEKCMALPESLDLGTAGATADDPGGMDGMQGDDLLMVLLLVLDLQVLQTHIPAGRRLLDQLDAGIRVRTDEDARKNLVQEVRSLLLDPAAAFWKRLAVQVHKVSQQLFTMHRGKKDDVMKTFAAHPGRKSRALSCMPSLLQIVYGTGSRTHVMFDSWMQSLCMMQGRLNNVSTPKGVFQFIEVPNVMQRIMKVYVDWDLLLSTVERSGFFACSTAQKVACSDVPSKVEMLRRLALRTPAAVCTILRDAGLLAGPGGDNGSAMGPSSDGSVFVLVKEGSRKVAVQATGKGGVAGGPTLQFPRLNQSHEVSGSKLPGPAAPDIPSPGSPPDAVDDWKISFHFIFQVLVSQSQFEAVYKIITSRIANESHDLAMVLNCVSMKGWGAHRKQQQQPHAMSKGVQAGGDPGASLKAVQADALRCVLVSDLEEQGSNAGVAAPLIGLDLHPKQNSHQGLACLGSRKPSHSAHVTSSIPPPASKLLGMMKIFVFDAGHNACTKAAPRGCCAWEWVDGYASDAHPLLILAEASILTPGPRCVGLCAAGFSLAHRESCAIPGGTSAKRAREVGGPVSAGPYSNDLRSDPHSIKQCRGFLVDGTKDCASSILLGSSHFGSKKVVGKDDVLRAVPVWFRGLVTDLTKNSGHGCADGLAHAFRSMTTGMQSLSVPTQVSRLSAKCFFARVSGTEICMCTLSMMQVPFKVSCCAQPV